MEMQKRKFGVNNPELLLGSAMTELLTKIVKEAVAEALKQNAEELPRYPEKVTINQAVEITGFTKNSLYQMHHNGRIPGALKVGGKLLFDTAALQAWVKNGGNAA
jgi:excisionase family DNA binding protein